MYPKVKVRAAEVDDDYELSVIPLQDFNSLSIRDDSPVTECKHLSIGKVPRSYIPRSVIPPPPLTKAAKKSGQEAENNAKPQTRSSSIPRPRAVMSSPDNDQILGIRNKMRSERPSALKNQNTVSWRQSAHSKPFERRSSPIPSALKNQNTSSCRHSASECRISPSTSIVRKHLNTAAVSEETADTSCTAQGKAGSAVVDIRVPRAHIVKAKPCFKT